MIIKQILKTTRLINIDLHVAALSREEAITDGGDKLDHGQRVQRLRGLQCDAQVLDGGIAQLLEC